MQEQHEDIIAFMVENNPEQFNFNKALEEAHEFCEALIKLQTKHPDNPKRPTREDVLKEYGDFMYRGLVAVFTLYKGEEQLADQQLEDHLHNKLSKLEAYKAEGKYKGGL